MKKIIIYTTNDKILSLKLVENVVLSEKLKKYKIDIFLAKPSFIRKLKILIVFIFFRSIRDLFKYSSRKVSVKDILKKNKNCRIIKEIKEDYEFGLSIYCSEKIKIEKFKTYNFHLGNLYDQRGSFIFFYKFINDWKTISLTFHQISQKFDVGKVINERKIYLEKNCAASEIFFTYLENLDFLVESINLLEKNEGKEYKNYEKLNVVPSFFNLIKKITFYFFRNKV